MKAFGYVLVSFSVLLMTLSSCCIDTGGAGDDLSTIILYGFSVKGEVFEERIIPAFKEMWKEGTGETVHFETSFAGSGKITNQVLNGAPAEVMVLSTEWDALQLKKAGMVKTDWNTFPHNGTVSTTPWVILAREGNPEGVIDLQDLAEKGMEIIHADPLTSGGACWSIFTLYGSELRRMNISTEEEAKSSARGLVKDVADNVISWQSSARKALSQYTMGYGDCLLTYENEAILSIAAGEELEIIYPKSTIFSEHKVVLVDENTDSKEMELVQGFIDFLFTEEVQGYMVEYHFRSILEDLNDGQVVIEDPFTIEYLGGWERAKVELIDGMFRDIRG